MSRATPALLTALLVGCAAPPKPAVRPAAPAASAAQDAPAGRAQAPSPLRSPAAGDAGTFRIYANETPLATVQFSFATSGRFERTATLSYAGQQVSTKLAVDFDAGAEWRRASASGPLGEVELSRKDGEALATVKKKTTSVKLEPGTLLFENFSPSLISLLIARYDRARRGKQVFPVLAFPSTPVKVTLEWQQRSARPLAGRDLEVDRFSIGFEHLDAFVSAAADGKVLLFEIPAQHAAMIRDGYETLRTVEPEDPKLSRPEREVMVERNLEVPMRDGLALKADVYRPHGEGQFPVILVRTPYKKELNEQQGRFYAARGYAYVVEDVRGRFGSPGTWEPFVHEPRDGYDSIEWLAARPWSSGKVGMIGGSYLGWVQWWAASQNPPHLTTIIPNVSPPDPFYNVPYEYGAFFLFGAMWWAEVLESQATADVSGAAFAKIADKKYSQVLRSLPVIDLDKAILGKENPYWRRWIAHPSNDSYWQQASFLDKLEAVRIPVFHQSGWFDGDGIGTKLNYAAMARAHHPNQKLILGPWGHTDQAARGFGDHDFGPAAVIDLQREYLRWFDHWLKGIDNGIDREPLVRIFVIGKNRWLEGQTYPLENTRSQKWFLGSDGAANTSRGDGRLTPSPPSGGAVVDRYTYDPADPTPAPDLYEEPDDEPGKIVSHDQRKQQAEAHHEKVTAARSDILVYATEPLKQPLTIAGPVSAVLFAASSARDTDWFMSLMDVDQAGKIFTLARAKLRARYRRSSTRPELLQPGKVYPFQLDLWHTGITIPVGHRLRVEVASAHFPLFSRNLNTGGHSETETEFVKAQQTIYHSKRYPSHLLLPEIPE